MHTTFTAKRTSTGIIVTGQVPTTPAATRPVLERLPSMENDELRFEVVFGRRNEVAPSKPVTMEKCELQLLGGNQQCRSIRIDLPDGSDVVLPLTAE